MAITYPRTLPSHTKIRSISISATSSVAKNSSPFTFSQSRFVYPGQMWSAEVSLPPMKRDDAERWIAFLLSLNGMGKSFLLGDPLNTAIRGTATSLSVTGSAGASTVSATIPDGQTILSGSWIQLGTGSDATLHKVLVDVTGTGGIVDMEIFPALRKARSAVSATLSNTVGVFYLASNITNYTINEVEQYGITFTAEEGL